MIERCWIGVASNATLRFWKCSMF